MLKGSLQFQIYFFCLRSSTHRQLGEASQAGMDASMLREDSRRDLATQPNPKAGWKVVCRKLVGQDQL